MSKTDDGSEARRLFAGRDNVAASGYARIEGIDFDLRHPAIHPDGWYSPTVEQWIIDTRPPLRGPHIYLPWQERCALKKRIADAREDLTRLVRSMLEHGAIPDPDVQRPDYFNKCIARIEHEYERERILVGGDGIRVLSVTESKTGNELDPEQDRQVKLAFIEIVRADGSTEQVNEPLKYFRRGSSMAIPRHRKMTFDAAATRVCDANGISNLYDLCYCADRLEEAMSGEVAGDNLLPSRAEILLQRAQSLVEDRAALVEYMVDKLPRKPNRMAMAVAEMEARRNILELIDGAVEFGYLLRLNEEEANVRSHAEDALRIGKERRAGGRERAKEWQRDAAENREFVLGLARAAREKTPNASREALARAVMDSTNIKLPSPRTIVRYISEFERQGHIPCRSSSANS